jgi:hypothetical protein
MADAGSTTSRAEPVDEFDNCDVKEGGGGGLQKEAEELRRDEHGDFCGPSG